MFCKSFWTRPLLPRGRGISPEIYLRAEHSTARRQSLMDEVPSQYTEPSGSLGSIYLVIIQQVRIGVAILNNRFAVGRLLILRTIYQVLPGTRNILCNNKRIILTPHPQVFSHARNFRLMPLSKKRSTAVVRNRSGRS